MLKQYYYEHIVPSLNIVTSLQKSEDVVLSRVALSLVQGFGIEGMWADGEHGYRTGYHRQMGKFCFVLQEYISNRMHRSPVFSCRV